MATRTTRAAPASWPRSPAPRSWRSTRRTAWAPRGWGRGTRCARAAARGVAALLPGHGPMLADPAGTLDYYIAHRAERLAAVEAALAAGETTLTGIVARVYVDVDRALWPFAEWSVRATLGYLAERGELPSGVSY